MTVFRLPQASGMTLRSPKGAASETVAELLSPREGLLRENSI